MTTMNITLCSRGQQQLNKAARPEILNQVQDDETIDLVINMTKDSNATRIGDSSLYAQNDDDNAQNDERQQ
jgi:hypothetical protein